MATWHLLDDGCRTLEAATVAGVANIGPGSVEWAGGDQIWVTGAASPFIVVVGPWCSSAGPAIAAMAVCAAFGRSSRAVRAAALAVILLIAGNLARMVAVVAIGARSGAAQLDVAHDGWATWWEVAVVLGSAAIIATALRGEAVAPVPAGPAVPETSDCATSR